MLSITILAVGLTAGGDPVQEADAQFAASLARPTMTYAEFCRLTDAGIKVLAVIPDHPSGGRDYHNYYEVEGKPKPVAQEVRPQSVFTVDPCPTGV